VAIVVGRAKSTTAPCRQLAWQIEMWKRRLMRIWKMEKGNCIFLLPGAAICRFLLLLLLLVRSGVGQARLSPNRNGCIQPWRTWPRGEGPKCISLNGSSAKKLLLINTSGPGLAGKLKVKPRYSSYSMFKNYRKQRKKLSKGQSI